MDDFVLPSTTSPTSGNCPFEMMLGKNLVLATVMSSPIAQSQANLLHSGMPLCLSSGSFQYLADNAKFLTVIVAARSG